ncbi:hypothetical protein MAR_006586 [Mya arenaria]|uniref:CCHC-type domain-containing protein n=1 Tax=Mya arenaria TaxID=6604 RepID=A0ABY7DGJ2_MYAAR|nr:hypothetical protein MAR_006586 [Mya arenaria]
MKRIDALVSITRDINQIVNERLSEIEEFKPQRELSRLKSLRNKDYAQSVFSLWESESNNSNKSVLSKKVADAAAALAEKKAKYEVLQEEEEQLSKLADKEIEQKRALEVHKKEMKKLEARREIKVAQARLNAYAQVYNSDETVPNIIIPPGDIKTEKQTEEVETLVKRASTKNDTSNESNLENQDFVNSDERAAFAKVLADSVNLNRLPVPEPNYLLAKTSFQTLIERKGIPPEEKIFYLKKYTGGPARKALEGFFYSGSKTAFESTQRVLHERYGHPFVVQKAFRDKLDKWPKIAAKDPIGLRDFADFLQGCKDALPHIPSLRILDDCTENQKLLNKLPDYATIGWNREVIQSMESNGSYPSFSQFVSFLAKEAKIACNPISSLYALNNNEDKKSKELRYSGNKAKVNTTSKPVFFCNKKGHYIFKCNGILSLTIDKKRDFIRNNSLCYGCLRKGHLNKDCRRKHTCNVCKGQHPSCLHEDRQYTVNNAPTSASLFRVSRNTEQSTSMIVPVWVSTKENPSQ